MNVHELTDRVTAFLMRFGTLMTSIYLQMDFWKRGINTSSNKNISAVLLG